MSPESSVVFFPCRSREETLDFYSRRLGLPLWKEFEGCLLFDTGAGYLGFVEYTDGRPLASGACISLNMKDQAEVDQAYAVLSAQGIPLEGRPSRHPRFPVYSFFLKDPNGYTLEFQKILD